MVQGVEIFREYFRDYTGQYAFIGGTACDIILGKLGEDFRVTKDLDIVLLVEALDESFAERFLNFVEDGGYSHYDKGKGKEQFYRFSNPKDRRFPKMIELFSRKPEYLDSKLNQLGPVHISDEVISLSAILLDNDYYELLKQGIVVYEDVSVLDMKQMILFKMKAWLDLSSRKAAGEQIDSKNIRKHKNDVLRLASYLDIKDSLEIAGQIKVDAENFINKIKDDITEPRDLNLPDISYEELLERLKACYNISEINVESR